MYEVGKYDVHDGMLSLIQLFLNDNMSAQNVLGIMDAVLFVIMVLGNVAYLAAVRPFIRMTAAESKRVAELMSLLPEDIDVEALIIQAGGLQADDESHTREAEKRKRRRAMRQAARKAKMQAIMQGIKDKFSGKDDEFDDEDEDDMYGVGAKDLSADDGEDQAPRGRRNRKIAPLDADGEIEPEEEEEEEAEEPPARATAGKQRRPNADEDDY